MCAIRLPFPSRILRISSPRLVRQTGIRCHCFPFPRLLSLHNRDIELLIRCTTRVSTRVVTIIRSFSFFFFFILESIDSKNFLEICRVRKEKFRRLAKGGFRNRKCHFGDACLNISN